MRQNKAQMASMMSEQSPAKTKLAILVNTVLGPAIADFVASLTDDEILELMKAYQTMNIDLIKDLTLAAKERKIQSKQWTDPKDSPFDEIMEQGLGDE